jgi:hypothetical protein
MRADVWRRLIGYVASLHLCFMFCKDKCKCKCIFMYRPCNVVCHQGMSGAAAGDHHYACSSLDRFTATKRSGRWRLPQHSERAYSPGVATGARSPRCEGLLSVLLQRHRWSDHDYLLSVLWQHHRWPFCIVLVCPVAVDHFAPGYITPLTPPLHNPCVSTGRQPLLVPRVGHLPRRRVHCVP